MTVDSRMVNHVIRVVRNISAYETLIIPRLVLVVDNGDNIKTIQNNLGHSTPELTLRIYAHSTDKMKSDSARRMDDRIRQLEQMR